MGRVDFLLRFWIISNIQNCLFFISAKTIEIVHVSAIRNWACSKIYTNRRYHIWAFFFQIFAMHYGSISGMLRNDISLRDLIFYTLKMFLWKIAKDELMAIYWITCHPRYTTRMLCEECNINIVYYQWLIIFTTESSELRALASVDLDIIKVVICWDI